MRSRRSRGNENEGRCTAGRHSMHDLPNCGEHSQNVVGAVLAKSYSINQLLARHRSTMKYLCHTWSRSQVDLIQLSLCRLQIIVWKQFDKRLELVLHAIPNGIKSSLLIFVMHFTRRTNHLCSENKKGPRNEVQIEQHMTS